MAGVLLGTAWHTADAARRERTHVPLLLFLGAIALALPVLGWIGIDEEAVRTFPF